MLPGFRFLFAATLLTVSLLVFGLGAAALLRASHERFASLPKQTIPAPVFTQMTDAAPPTLSMLRVEQTPIVEDGTSASSSVDTLLPADRLAALITAPRLEQPSAPIVEPKTEMPPDPAPAPSRVETRAEPLAQTAIEIEGQVPAAPVAETIIAAQLPTPAAPTEAIAGSGGTSTGADASVAAAPEPAPQQIAALPAPEVTGALAAPETGEPLINTRPIRKPPIPRDRPAAADAVAALPDPAVSAPPIEARPPAARKRRPVVKRTVAPKRRVVVRPAPARPAPPSSFGTTGFGTSPFGT